jgi:hypothetical protein
MICTKLGLINSLGENKEEPSQAECVGLKGLQSSDILHEEPTEGSCGGLNV